MGRRRRRRGEEGEKGEGKYVNREKEGKEVSCETHCHCQSVYVEEQPAAALESV